MSACIGTDEVDDPIVGAEITLDREQAAVLVGDTIMVTATYFNQYGIEESVEPIWASSNVSIATVSENGLVAAISPGQANIRAVFGEVESQDMLVTVVESEDDIANVTLSSPAGNQINIGQEVELELLVTNINGDPVDGFEVEFTSLDPDYLSVNNEGVVTGLANGLGRVVAEVGGIQSNILGIQVGVTSRSGTFSGANGYDAEGITELFVASNGDLILELNDDFETDFALGTFIYLSNSTSGSVTRNEGVEVTEITTGGFHSFNITDLDADITIDDYNYVIVLCKPATITFGYAELNP